MIRHLTLKPDFDQTINRFAAWWLVDRLSSPRPRAQV